MTDKFAQERGILNKLRENINLSGKMLEKISPEIAETMDRLRETDENIRQQAEGLKALTRAAKSLVNRRDYLSAAINFSAFHERCRSIASMLDKFKSSVNLKHYKFLLNQFDDEQKEQLFGYDPEQKLASNIDTSLNKQAGLSDWWFNMTDPLADLAHNLTSQRGAAMRALEKRFSVAFLKTLKEDSIVMAVKTEEFLRYVLLEFKKLATALAKRDINSYIERANAFISRFSEYHKQFIKYHSKNIVPLKAQHEHLIEEARKAYEDESRRKEEEATNIRNAPKSAPPNVSFDSDKPAPEQKPPSKEENVDALKKLDELSSPAALKAANNAFIHRLESLAVQSNPAQFLKAILAHSSRIEDVDSDISLKLLAIAEGMAEDDEFGWMGAKPQNDPENVPAKKEEDSSRPFDLAPPERRQAPLRLDVPNGRLDKPYSSIPALQSVSIRTTSSAADHIVKVFIKRLYDLGLDDMYEFDDAFPSKLMHELRNAIPRGLVLSVNQAEDSHNPLDKQLDIYTIINLNTIDSTFKGTSKVRILARLSMHNKTLTIRTIQSKFTIEK